MLLNSSASKVLCKIVIIKPDISPFGLLTNVFLIVGCICCLPCESAFVVAFRSDLGKYHCPCVKLLSTLESFRSSVTVARKAGKARRARRGP